MRDELPAQVAHGKIMVGLLPLKYPCSSGFFLSSLAHRTPHCCRQAKESSLWPGLWASVQSQEVQALHPFLPTVPLVSVSANAAETLPDRAYQTFCIKEALRHNVSCSLLHIAKGSPSCLE
jgi:hypothetical protein